MTSHPMWTIRKLLSWATGYLQDHRIDSPRLTAEILLCGALKVNRIDLYLDFAKPLSGKELKRFKALLRRRISREPLAYITGKKEFWSLELSVSPAVLIPRPETECLVEVALAFLDRTGSGAGQRVLDLGTGSGAVIIALAAERPQHVYVATDLSAAAVEIARVNAVRHGVASLIGFVCADWFGAFAPPVARFDLIIANPPYIPSGTLPELEPEIFAHEPHLALDGAADGLGPLRRITAAAPSFLTAGGCLLLEIGYDQRDAVGRLAQAGGEYAPVRYMRDLGGHDRVAVLEKK